MPTLSARLTAHIAVVVDRILFGGSGSRAGTGSGVAATQHRSLPPFTGGDLAGDNNARISGSGTILCGGGPAKVSRSVTGSGTISPG